MNGTDERRSLYRSQSDNCNLIIYFDVYCQVMSGVAKISMEFDFDFHFWNFSPFGFFFFFLVDLDVRIKDRRLNDL